MIGKPKVGDVVKVHYIASVHGKKGWEIVNTKAHALVQFRIAKDSSQHKGLWRGLNELIIKGDVQLGDAIQAEIPPELAFGKEGLERRYEVNGGFTQAAIGNDTMMAVPNDPNCPPSHKERNPLGLAYVPVAPNSTIDIKLELMQVNHHRREIKEMTCGECICSAIMSGLGCNDFGERTRF